MGDVFKIGGMASSYYSTLLANWSYPRPRRESGRRAAATGSEKEPTQLDEFATASALRSIVSNAIFWASETSPRTNSPFGMKHQRMMQRPDSSSC
jgi:hypothetical protein